MTTLIDFFCGAGGSSSAKWQQRHGTDAQKLARVRAVIDQAPDSVLVRQIRKALEDKQ